MIKRAFIVAAVVGVAGLVFFDWLGGFNDIKFQRIQNAGYTIVGKEYQGKNGSAELEDLFLQFRTFVEEESPDDILVIVSYEQQNQPKGNVHYFVGVLIDEVPENVTEDFEILEIKTSEFISARIESSSVVMPTSNKVKTDALEYLKDGESLDYFSIEKYLEEGVMEIDFPIIKN